MSTYSDAEFTLSIADAMCAIRMKQSNYLAGYLTTNENTVEFYFSNDNGLHWDALEVNLSTSTNVDGLIQIGGNYQLIGFKTSAPTPTPAILVGHKKFMSNYDYSDTITQTTYNDLSNYLWLYTEPSAWLFVVVATGSTVTLIPYSLEIIATGPIKLELYNVTLNSITDPTITNNSQYLISPDTIDVASAVLTQTVQIIDFRSIVSFNLQTVSTALSGWAVKAVPLDVSDIRCDFSFNWKELS